MKAAVYDVEGAPCVLKYVDIPIRLQDLTTS